MKKIAVWLSLLFVPCSDVIAAYQNFPMENRIPVILMDGNGQPGIKHYEVRRNLYLFRVEVLSDSEGIVPESSRNGRPFIVAQRDERFAVRLYNPLPVRVAVNLTVDGLNSITGKPSGISEGDKWMIDPYSFITLRGWQVNSGESRRFFFTDKHVSYAKWNGDRTGKNLSVNCGVIGVAYFWNKKELAGYYESHPEYRYTYGCRYPMNCLQSKSSRRAMNGAEAASVQNRGISLQESLAMPKAKATGEPQLAGTGMGERESNPTTLVDFSYDTGMYQVAQAVVIYYDFPKLDPIPNPFPAISYAPEMP